ncbi:MAG: hypothetical protein HQ519_08630 [Planctomycetes bacterium]|nr:hypothetical protein [Planctomycetota bacterium]NQU48698.1 hypothetical protein [Planctomycetota bacterium]
MKYLLTIALAVCAWAGLSACQAPEGAATDKDTSVDAVISPVNFNVTGMT